MIYSKDAKEALATLIKEAAAETKPVQPLPTSSLKFSKDTMFTYEYTHPVVLDLLCMKHFGHEWLSWIAETIIQEIKKTFNQEISRVNFSKLMAVKTLHIVDTYWEEWEVFEKINVALNGVPVSVGIVQGLDTINLMNGIEIANTVRKETFNEEIARFTAACLIHDDIHYAPPPLDFAQKFIPFTFELEKNRFEQLSKEPFPFIKETPEDVQAAKLIMANDYRVLKIKELKDQLGLVDQYIK